MRRMLDGLCVMLALAAVPMAVAAQQTGTVQGTVSDQVTRAPLSGVQVFIVGTTTGAITDQDGGFQLTGVPAGQQTVRAERIGYGETERQVTVPAGGTTTVQLQLSESAIGLDQIVVTALGVERTRREVTTSVQSVSGEALVRAPESNLVSTLSGKVAGVHIISSNTPGGSARMVIRGVNSLTGNNQPLFVLDGIPVSNSYSTSGTRGYNAIDYGNLISDLNPNDIQSVTVLKGANAAALYGSRAANGVVLIQTKKGTGARDLTITARADMTFDSPLKLPDYQDMYGQGSRGNFQATTDESWGPRMDGQLIVQPLYGDDAAPFLPHPDNVRDFFETGRTNNTSVALATGSENSSLRLSLSNMQQEGMLPGFEQDRTTVALNGAMGLAERLRGEASLQYMKAEAANRPAQGYGEDNVMWQFLWFGRQVDTDMLRQRQRNEDGSQYNWNSRWNNNPYWTQLIDQNWDSRDRFIGGGSLTYSVTSWLDVMARAGTDMSSEHRKDVYADGSKSVSSDTGAFGEDTRSRSETNMDFLMTAEVPNLEDYSINVTFGGSRRDNEFRSLGAWADSLVVPMLWDLDNSAVPAITNDYREETRVNSLYGSLNFGFRNYWFIEATGRNDWSSTLPAQNNSYFYPSVSSSLIVSDVVDLPGVSYGKVRLGWAEVGNDASAYQLIDPYVADPVPFGGAPRFTASNQLRNSNLKPEITESWEAGAEVRFLNDRLGLDFTYYSTETSNQIVPVQISPVTGFTSKILNAGTISNKGIELLVDATPVMLDNGFRWDVTANFGKNNNEVVELAEGLETLTLDTYYGVSVQARVGESYGSMYGRKYVRDSQGNIVVGDNGRPLNTSSNPHDYLGNYNPDWTGGLRNTLRYGPVSAYVQIDGQKGGAIYSLTQAYGVRSGVLIESLEGRREGRTPAEGGGLIVPGVRVVDGDTVPNDIVVDAQDYWRNLTGLHEEFVHDASYVKLREVRIGFQVPQAWTNRIGLATAEIALIGRNLALWSDVPHIDPETAFNAGNVQGFEYSQTPSARTIGFSVQLTH